MVKIIERTADRLTAWIAPKATVEASCPGAGTTYRNFRCVNHHYQYESCYVAGNCVGICTNDWITTGSC